MEIRRGSFKLRLWVMSSYNMWLPKAECQNLFSFLCWVDHGGEGWGVGESRGDGLCPLVVGGLIWLGRWLERHLKRLEDYAYDCGFVLCGIGWLGQDLEPEPGEPRLTFSSDNTLKESPLDPLCHYRRFQWSLLSTVSLNPDSELKWSPWRHWIMPGMNPPCLLSSRSPWRGRAPLSSAAAWMIFRTTDSSITKTSFTSLLRIHSQGNSGLNCCSHKAEGSNY